jgi:hypothetical protein
MATTTRQATKTITMPPAVEESVPEPVTQRRYAARVSEPVGGSHTSS